ncbi:MAG: cation transporter [Magnetococcales bacterium]|nr:cation transporter [Magnetococcales bacterium]
MATTQEAYLVTRTLKVEEMVCVECEEIIAEALTMLSGVTAVDSNWEKGQVTASYDLHKTHIQELEKLLSDIGYPPSKGFLARKMRDWIHYTEKNEVDNLKHVGHCCSKPPAGA